MDREQVIVTLLCPSQADAESVRASIETKLAEKLFPKYTITPRVERVQPSTWGVVMVVSYLARLDAVDVRDAIVNRWATGGLRNKILAGSEVTIHTCSHDDGELPPYQSCRDRNFEKRRK